jgi:hypothetical protein
VFKFKSPTQTLPSSFKHNDRLLEFDREILEHNLSKTSTPTNPEIASLNRLNSLTSVKSSSQSVYRMPTMDIKKYQQLATTTHLETASNNVECQIEIQPPGSLIPAATAKSSSRISAQELHKYVGGLVGVFLLFSITFPVAMMRVSHHPKFALDRSHVKSLTTADRASLTN